MACADDDPRCLDAMSHLDRYMDVELTDEHYEQLQQHFEACPPCLEQFVLLQDVSWRIRESLGGCCQVSETARQQIVTLTVQSFRITRG